jgi:hypothetical protein
VTHYLEIDGSLAGEFLAHYMESWRLTGWRDGGSSLSGEVPVVALCLLIKWLFCP